MPFPHNDPWFHVPQPVARPGETPDFSHVDIGLAGSVPRPPIDARADDMRDYAYSLIRVLDDDGAAIGDWDPDLSPQDLKRGLRAMMLTRAYDARMVRVQRQGRSEEHTSELQSLMRISYAVYCLKKKKKEHK